MTGKRTIALSLLILCFGGALRIYRLGIASLWFDEALLHYYTKNLSNLLKLNYSIPPLYIIFISFWERLNNSEFFLRLPSVFFALLTILSVYIVGKDFFSKKQGLLSIFLLAIAPFHIYYSQEANKYALLGLFGILSVYFLYKSLQSSKFLFWLVYMIFTILSILTHYIFLLVFFSQGLFVISQLRKYKKIILKWLIAQILLILVIFPWLPTIFFQIRDDFNIGLYFWSGPVGLKTLLTVFGYLYFGYNANLAVFLLGVLLFSCLFFKGIFTYRRSNQMLYLAFLTIFPILTAWVISFYKPMFVYRYFMVSALLSYIIIACGILSFKRRSTKLFLALSIMLMSFYCLNNYYTATFPSGVSRKFGISARQDLRSLSKFLAENFRPGDIICHNNVYTIPPLEYYLIDRLTVSGKFKISEYLTNEVKQRRCLVFTKKEEVALYLLNIKYLQNAVTGDFSYNKKLSLEETTFDRMWLVSHSAQEEEKTIDWVNNNFKKDNEIEFHALKLFLYLNPKGA